MVEPMLYLECSSGISGDMSVAALLDLGADEKAVRQALESLPVQGFHTVISRVTKSGLDVCDFDVQLDEAHQNHDHDMEYLHGSHEGHVHGTSPHNHDHEHEHDHHHEHHHGQDYDHDHHHDYSLEHGHDHGHGNNYEHQHELASQTQSRHHHHDHEHRGLQEVTAIIQAAQMTDHAKEIALRIFHILAEAEAKAHGRPVDEVHFHEVGAIDSIADIVAFAVAFDSLAVRDVVVTELAEGKGSIRCQHGLIPVPAPAVVFIASAYDIPLRVLPIQGELVTPTGAAIVAAIRTHSELPEKFIIKRVGMGNGKRVYETPGLLRAMIIEGV